MPSATEIFVPSDFPRITYVEREDEKLERRVRDAIGTPRSPISVSGPSKSGKTALIRKIVGDDNIIHIFGAQISSPSDLWEVVLQWMDTPTSNTEIKATSDTAGPSLNASATLGLSGVGSVTVGGGGSRSVSSSSSSTVVTQIRGMSGVVREIGNSEFLVFLDDFHYIPRELQEAIGRQIKVGSEAGIRFCIASVPHRSDDVVRSNPELRGRTINIDTSFWTREDLLKIAEKGFDALNAVIDPAVLEKFAQESCTSPQIMQAVCLQLCFNLRLRVAYETKCNLKVTTEDVSDALEQTSSRADYTSLVKQMHAGPRVRGTERKEFEFKDGSKGDAYRACLLALAADPPAMEFNYADLQSRITSVCVNEKPVGSSVTESLKQIAGFADLMHPNQRIVEWDPDTASGTFAVIDPYFLFFLRASDLLKALG